MPPDHPLQHLHGRCFLTEIGFGKQAPHGAGQFTPRSADSGIEFLDHIVLQQEFRMAGRDMGGEAVQDFAAHRRVGQADLHGGCALQFADQPLAEADGLAGGSVAHEDNLSAIAGHFADVLEQLVLRAGFAGNPVQVVDDQDRCRPQPALQAAGVTRFHPVEIARHEFLGGQVNHLAVGIAFRHVRFQRHHDVRLAGALRSVDQRDRRAGRKACRNPLRYFCRRPVRRANNEIVERHRRAARRRRGNFGPVRRFGVRVDCPRVANQLAQFGRSSPPTDQFDRAALRVHARPQPLDLALVLGADAVETHGVLGSEQHFTVKLCDQAQFRNPAVKLFTRETGPEHGLHILPDALPGGITTARILCSLFYARDKQSFSVHRRPHF